MSRLRAGPSGARGTGLPSTMRVAGAAESMTAVYAFSWAGLDVGRLEVLLEADGGGYRASWEAGTAGLVGTLFPFSSQGMRRGPARRRALPAQPL